MLENSVRRNLSPIFKLLRRPRIDSKESTARLCSLTKHLRRKKIQLNFFFFFFDQKFLQFTYSLDLHKGRPSYSKSLQPSALQKMKFINCFLFFWVIFCTPMPEFIDPVFAKTSPKRSFSLIENKRSGLVFEKTGSINSGTGSGSNSDADPQHW